MGSACKVLETSSLAEREATERIAFERPISKFRLAEAEPEEAFFKSIELEAVFASGKKVTLKPSEITGGRKYGQYIWLPAYQALEVKFDIPQFAEDKPVSTEISVTGYYTRHTLISASSKR